MPKVTVQIDPSACILTAICVGIEPRLFQIGQEPYVELTDASGSNEAVEADQEGGQRFSGSGGIPRETNPWIEITQGREHITG